MPYTCHAPRRHFHSFRDEKWPEAFTAYIQQHRKSTPFTLLSLSPILQLQLRTTLLSAHVEKLQGHLTQQARHRDPKKSREVHQIEHQIEHTTAYQDGWRA